MFQNKR